MGRTTCPLRLHFHAYRRVKSPTFGLSCENASKPFIGLLLELSVDIADKRHSILTVGNGKQVIRRQIVE